MKKLLAILSVLLLFSTVLGDATDTRISSIRPQHDSGFFVEFSSIGYSFENNEITSQPLFDILGQFNLGFKHYFTKNTVFSAQGFFVDAQFVPTVYGGAERTDPGIFVLLGRTYLHGDYPIYNLSVKPHIEVLSGGAIIDDGYAIGSLSKSAITVAFSVNTNIEIFSRVESGLLIDVLHSSTDTSVQEAINQARRDMAYVVANVGLTWYYDSYSGIEVGYRFFLLNRDSPFTYFQGLSYTDYVFNYLKLLNDSLPPEEKIIIPFITTDYYISFSVKF
ncbi:MAG TPA: hypothetical protein PLQ59_07605 [Fervidobacterium sp.]|jgi:hypothetical protein|nr:hypothetical protein [Fervidobacterium sp.]HOH54071.1 hypothetical protein [Fervidobacterium sp.]HOL04364.1 hypothetical protein [Fervidobacterium sp.]HPC25358.1 hypothetical protein [Fervidobacterium sp.]